MTVQARETFGSLLRRYRLAAGLSQEALAERAGLSSAAIAHLERGWRSAPRLLTVGMPADALHLEQKHRAALIAAAIKCDAAARSTRWKRFTASPGRSICRLPWSTKVSYGKPSVTVIGATARYLGDLDRATALGLDQAVAAAEVDEYLPGSS